MTQPHAARPRLLSRCRVGGHAFALDLAAVRGVERADRLAPAADAWPQLGDLATTAGRVPVLSLAGLLGLKPGPHEPNAQLAVCDTADGPVAFLVDGMAQVFEAAPDAVCDVPRSVGPVRFAGLLRQGDDLVPVVNPADLLAEPRAAGLLSPPGGRVARGSANRLLLLPLTADAPGERPWLAGVPMAAAAEVIRADRVVPLPGAWPCVLGVAGWRGGAVAVVDLPAWLGFPPASGAADARVVVAFPAAGGEPVGLLVRRGVRVLKLPAPHVCSARPFPGDPRRAPAAVEVGPATVGLADLAELFAGPAS